MWGEEEGGMLRRRHQYQERDGEERKTETHVEKTCVIETDTPQFLGGNPYFFCENLYQSVSIVDASMYRDIFHAIRVATQFAKKLRHCVDASNPNRGLLGATELKNCLVKIGVLRHVARLSLILVNDDPRETKFPGNLAEKASCVDDRTVVSLHIPNNLFSVICLKSVSLRDHLKNGTNPYWIRTIRTRWHVW